MKLKNTILIGAIGFATLSLNAGAAVILADDFTGVGDTEKSGQTGTFTSWNTVDGIDAPASSLTFSVTSGLTSGFHETRDGQMDVNENIGNGGTWTTSVTLNLDTNTTAIDLTSLDLVVELLGGTGSTQAVGNLPNFNGRYTVSLAGSTSGALGSVNTETGYTSATGVPISVDLSGYGALNASETYTLSLSVDEGAGSPWGHHVSLDSFSLSGNITAVPEPSSAALLGLGGLALILRRRR